MSRRLGVISGTLVVLLATGAGLFSLLWPETELPGVAREPAPTVEDLMFLDHAEPGEAREVGIVPEEGELTFLYFGYLSCPDICPMTMIDIARAQREVGDELAARTNVAFVTVDPARDDPERLRSYLAHFFEGSYLALTAPDEDSLDAAAERLGVRYEIEPHEPGDDRYDVAHSAITYVIDDRGLVVRELPFGVTSEELARVMRALL
jgi:protein SCO1